MARFQKDQQVVYRARGGRKFLAKIADPRIRAGEISIIVATDPFPVLVNVFQISQKEEDMPATKKKAPAARELANEAKMLGIKGYRSMTGTQLQKAVAKAQAAKKPPPRKPRASKPTKRTPKKAAGPVKRRRPRKAAAKVARTPRKKPVKTASSKVVAQHKDNPFRPGSNLFYMAEELLQGGVKTEMVKRLKKRMHLNPWSKDKEEDPERAINKRLMMTAKDMQHSYGFKIFTEGRGLAATIRVSKSRSPRKGSGQKAKSKSNSRRTTSKR